MFKRKRGTDNSLTNTIVTSDTVKNSPVKHTELAPLSPRKKIMTLRAWIGVLVLMLLLACAGWLIYQKNKKPEPTGRQVVCSDTVIRAASEKINASDIIAVQKVVEDIAELKYHELDPNCEYIMVRFALMRGDTAGAEKHLALLSETYDPKLSYSSAFDIPLLTPEELATVIADVGKSQDVIAEEDAARQESLAEQDSAADKAAPKGSR